MLTSLQTNRFENTLVILGVLLLFFTFSCKPKPYVLTEYKVKIQANQLIPNSIDVIQGGKLIWTNEDTVAHILKSGAVADPTNLFEVGPIKPGESVSFEFDSLGSFPYYCVESPNLSGIVNIKKDTVIVEKYPLTQLPHQ